MFNESNITKQNKYFFVHVIDAISLVKNYTMLS